MPAFRPVGDVSLNPLLGFPVGLRDRRDDLVGLPADLDHQTAGLPYGLAWRLAVDPEALASGVEEGGGVVRLVLGDQIEALRDDCPLLEPERVDGAKEVAGDRCLRQSEFRLRLVGQPFVRRRQARFPHLCGDVLDGGLLLPRGRGRQRGQRGRGRALQPEAELIAKNESGRHRAHLGERRPFGHLQSETGLQRAPQFPAGALLIDLAVTAFVRNPVGDRGAGVGVAEDALQQRGAVCRPRVLGHPREVGVGELVAA